MEEDFKARQALGAYVDNKAGSSKEQYRVENKKRDVPIYFEEGADVGESEAVTFKGTPWAEKLNEMKKEGEASNTIGQDAIDYYFNQDEIGIKHPVKQSVIKLTDEGFIDIFADDQLGIRIDPHSKSINFLGDTVNILTKKLNVKTVPNGFIWNDYYFNPQLYFEDEKERGQVLSGTKEYYHATHGENPSVAWHRDDWSVQPMKKSQRSFRYSAGVKNIMKELGIATPDE